MTLFSWFKRMLAPTQARTYALGGPPLDPDKVYELRFVANFDDKHAAELCVTSLAHLNLSAQVDELANGRWNADLAFTGKADPAAVDKLKSAIDESAQRHGGKLGLFFARPVPAGTNAD